jgi:hypothetical protein
MTPERRRQRERIRAGYGQQPWAKVIAYIVIAGLRMKIRKIFRKEE